MDPLAAVTRADVNFTPSGKAETPPGYHRRFEDGSSPEPAREARWRIVPPEPLRRRGAGSGAEPQRKPGRSLTESGTLAAPAPGRVAGWGCVGRDGREPGAGPPIAAKPQKAEPNRGTRPIEEPRHHDTSTLAAVGLKKQNGARRGRRRSARVGRATALGRGPLGREAPRCVAPAAARAGGTQEAGAEPRSGQRRAARPWQGGGPGWWEARDEPRQLDFPVVVGRSTAERPLEVVGGRVSPAGAEPIICVAAPGVAHRAVPRAALASQSPPVGGTAH